LPNLLTFRGTCIVDIVCPPLPQTCSAPRPTCPRCHRRVPLPAPPARPQRAYVAHAAPKKLRSAKCSRICGFISSAESVQTSIGG
jgi:hypothetical protein